MGWVPQRNLGLLALQSTLRAGAITQDACLLMGKLLLCYPFPYGPQLSHLYDGDIIIMELKTYSLSLWFCEEGTITVRLERFRDLPKVKEPAKSTGRNGA